MTITDWREANRANWDERVEVHLKAHDLGSLRAGRARRRSADRCLHCWVGEFQRIPGMRPQLGKFSQFLHSRRRNQRFSLASLGEPSS